MLWQLFNYIRSTVKTEAKTRCNKDRKYILGRNLCKDFLRLIVNLINRIEIFGLNIGLKS